MRMKNRILFFVDVSAISGAYECGHSLAQIMRNSCSQNSSYFSTCHDYNVGGDGDISRAGVRVEAVVVLVSSSGELFMYCRSQESTERREQTQSVMKEDNNRANKKSNLSWLTREEAIHALDEIGGRSNNCRKEISGGQPLENIENLNAAWCKITRKTLLRNCENSFNEKCGDFISAIDVVISFVYYN